MMLSANIHELEKSNMLARYHNDYLSKPVSRELLLAKLSKLLPIDWVFENESESHSSVTANATHQIALNTVPKNDDLVLLRDYASIGFMSGFNEKTTELINSDPSNIAFYTAMQDDMSQCHFDKIVNNLDELINEHYPIQ